MSQELAVTGALNAPQLVLNEQDIKKYIAPQATEKELYLFIGIAKSYGLNPFKREIYFLKYGGKDAAIIVGYESYIKRAERTGLLDGWEVQLGKDELGEKATITIHRKDRGKPFVWTVYRKEFDSGQANWVKMPLFMLRKVAISQGFRLAFPEEIGGMPYIPEELPKAGTSDELPKGDVIEGELVQDQAPGFQAPAGMDEMPDHGPAAGQGKPQINVDGLAGFLGGVAELDELAAEYKVVTDDPRWLNSDQKAINRLFNARKAALSQP